MSETISPADSSEPRVPVVSQTHVDKILDLRKVKPRNHSEEQPLLKNKSTLPVSTRDPRLWKRTDVCCWLQWAVDFYQLDNVDTHRFAMNGRGLCLLTLSGFMSRAPSCGDVLHTDFQRRYAVAVLQDERERKAKHLLKRGCSQITNQATNEGTKRHKGEQSQSQM